VTDRTCSHPDGCPRPQLAGGWCRMHYTRVLKTGDPGPVAAIRIRGDDHARFESKCDRSGGPDACHLWRGYLNPEGYGRLRLIAGNRLAHDLAWEWANGAPIPAGYEIDHECHNEAVRAGTCKAGLCPHRSCCNERHLVARTRQEHLGATAWRPVRAVPGTRPGTASPAAKLIESDIPAIRAALAAGESQATIGLRYGVSQTAIGLIGLGKTWRHVA